MKELFLSFRTEYFKPLLYGVKKYEYRKRFCNEETVAYLYLSGKSRQVVGIMELGVPIRLDKTRDNYLDYPMYTKPYEYRGMKVPDVLVSGDHKKIDEWRRIEREKKTKEKRPDLLGDD